MKTLDEGTAPSSLLRGSRGWLLCAGAALFVVVAVPFARAEVPGSDLEAVPGVVGPGAITPPGVLTPPAAPSSIGGTVSFVDAQAEEPVLTTTYAPVSAPVTVETPEPDEAADIEIVLPPIVETLPPASESVPAPVIAAEPEAEAVPEPVSVPVIAAEPEAEAVPEPAPAPTRVSAVRLRTPRLFSVLRTPPPPEPAP